MEIEFRGERHCVSVVVTNFFKHRGKNIFKKDVAVRLCATSISPGREADGESTQVELFYEIDGIDGSEYENRVVETDDMIDWSKLSNVCSHPNFAKAMKECIEDDSDVNYAFLAFALQTLVAAQVWKFELNCHEVDGEARFIINNAGFVCDGDCKLDKLKPYLALEL
jgi:hypothetical protein